MATGWRTETGEDVSRGEPDHRGLGDLVDLGPVGAGRKRQRDERQEPDGYRQILTPADARPPGPSGKFAESRRFDNAADVPTVRPP